MLPFHGKYPKLDPKSCVMPGAELAGDVELKEYASIWQNCALRGDVNKIVVGRYSNVQDNSVLHVDDDRDNFNACILQWFNIWYRIACSKCYKCRLFFNDNIH